MTLMVPAIVTFPVARRSNTPEPVVVITTPAGMLIVVKLCTPGESAALAVGLYGPSNPVLTNSHTPATHELPAGQTLAHPPQLFTSVWLFTLHPCESTPSQFANPVLHMMLQAPATQVGVAFACVGQTLPHVLQLFGSVSTSTHAPPHSEAPAMHAKPHTLLVHVGVAFARVGQVVPHAPQCCGSDRGSAHAPPHAISGAVHVAMHAPIEHIASAAHAWPHAPQLFESVNGFAQDAAPASAVPASPPPHVSIPTGHTSAHTPIAHTSPAGQTVPQAPQFAGSSCVFVQLPPHAVSRGPHDAVHMPDEQVCPGPHMVPQAPQFALSVRVLTHRLPHRTCPVGHVDPASVDRVSVDPASIDPVSVDEPSPPSPPSVDGDDDDEHAARSPTTAKRESDRSERSFMMLTIGDARLQDKQLQSTSVDIYADEVGIRTLPRGPDRWHPPKAVRPARRGVHLRSRTPTEKVETP